MGKGIGYGGGGTRTRPRVPARKAQNHEQYGSAGEEGKELGDIHGSFGLIVAPDTARSVATRIKPGPNWGQIIARGAKKLFTGLIPAESDASIKTRAETDYFNAIANEKNLGIRPKGRRG